MSKEQYELVCKAEFSDIKHNQKEQGDRLMEIEKKIFNGFGESIIQIRKMLWFVLSGLGTVATAVVLSIILGG